MHGLDQPGTLTALTGVFSTRGVSFDSLATEPVDDDGRAGRIVVTFRATPRRTRALERAVRRERPPGEQAVQAPPQRLEITQAAQRPGADLDEADGDRGVLDAHALSSSVGSSASSKRSTTPLSSSRSRTRRGTRSRTGAPEPAVAAW